MDLPPPKKVFLCNCIKIQARFEILLVTTKVEGYRDVICLYLLVFVLVRQLTPETKPLIMSEEPLIKSVFLLQNKKQKIDIMHQERRLGTLKSTSNFLLKCQHHDFKTVESIAAGTWIPALNVPLVLLKKYNFNKLKYLMSM